LPATPRNGTVDVPSAIARIVALASRHRTLIGIVALGATIRVGWWWYAHPGPVSDYLGYRSFALRLVTTGEYTRGGLPSAWRAPGYPLFLAAGMVVSRAGMWLSLLNVVVSCAAIPLTWCFARRLGFGERVALLAAVMVAVSPTLVLWSAVLGSENLQLPLVLGAWVLTSRVTRVAPAALAGVLFGLAILVRPESLFYLLAAPALVRLATGSWQTAVRLSVVVISACVVVLLPWYVRNEAVVGHSVGLSSTGGINFYLAHRPSGYAWVPLTQTPLDGLSESAASQTGYRLGWDAIKHRPLALVSDIAHGTRELYSMPHYSVKYSTVHTSRYPPYRRTVPSLAVSIGTVAADAAWIATAALLPVGVAALLVAAARRTALLALLALVIANWFCFAVVFWGHARYRFAIEPVLAIVAAVGVNSLTERRRRRVCMTTVTPTTGCTTPPEG
jgi:hypothetical protein